MHDKPKGAIWASRAKLPDASIRVYEQLTAVGELGFYGASNLKVKILSLREKFIAVPNRKKEGLACECTFEDVSGRRQKRTCRRCSQPDFFLHVYQEYTGQAARVSWVKTTVTTSQNSVSAVNSNEAAAGTTPWADAATTPGPPSGQFFPPAVGAEALVTGRPAVKANEDWETLTTGAT